MNESRSDGSGIVVGIVLCLVLCLLLAGGGAFWVFYRSQVRAVELARAQELLARREVEAARSQQQRLVQDQVSNQTVRAEVEEQKSNNGSEVDSSGNSPADQSIVKQIESLLTEHASTWNAHNIERFMDYYWKSDELSFSSSGKTIYGWTATLDRYRTGYPNPEAMGKVTFDDLKITVLGNSAAMVLGHWKLDRDKPIAGNFTLVLRKIDGRWLIIHDHTSLESGD